MRRWFRGFQRRSRREPHSASRPRLGPEQLEDRCLLSGPPPAIPYGPLPAVTAGLTAEQVGHADAVIDWNATMLRAVWNEATPPTPASRVMAMVGVAVYDAVDGVCPDYDLYPVPGLCARPAPDASPEAAAIAAADTVLSALYPGQRALFEAEYQATLARTPKGKPRADGIAWGRAVAGAVLAWRSQDGSDQVVNYTPAPPGGPPGVYELTPPDYLPALSPQWPQVTPWAMTSAAQFLPPGPPPLDSARYAADFNRTKSLGALDSTTRTPDQTLYAHFWADVPGHSVTPPGHWNEIAEHVSLQRHLTLEQNARLFALLNIGLADAAISCWDAKYTYNFWRPITAIRYAGDAALNPATSPDPSWTPLWATPNFPEYTSGHSTFSGTADAILTSVFGRHTPFTIGSDDMPGYTRSFTSFSRAADEAGESRVVGGIHFETANHDGLRSGRELGHFVVQHFLLPAHQGHRRPGRAAGGRPGGAGDHGSDVDPRQAALRAGVPGLALAQGEPPSPGRGGSGSLGAGAALGYRGRGPARCSILFATPYYGSPGALWW